MVHSIDINGVTMKASGTDFWLGRIDGLATPTYRTTTVIYAGRHGGNVPKQLYGQRIVTIEGGIDERSCNDHLAARQELLAALPIGVNVPVTFHMSDGRALLMYAKFEQPSLPIDARLSTDFQLVAIADDYRLFDASTGNVNTISVSKLVSGGLRWFTGGDGSGLRWFTGSGLRWHEGAGAENAVNTGSTASNPIITIYGVNQNPIVRNMTTGELIKVNITTSSTDVIVIDTNLKSTSLNGGNINSLVDSTSTYFDLEPGDNLIEFTNDNASGGYAVIDWYNAYMGV